MDKILNNIDTAVCKKYINNYNYHYYTSEFTTLLKINIDISILLKFISDANALYNAVRMHPGLTPEILISIIKKIDRTSCYLNKCWLITQEFCETYKDVFTLTKSEMITNQLPVNYIIDIYGPLLTKEDYYYISKYCTEHEFNNYCKSYNIIPSLDNPNMTIEWFISSCITKDDEWNTLLLLRPDLITADVIMTYKSYIGNNSDVWKTCFNLLPVEFISMNLQYTYSNISTCIETFKGHPGGISWYIIDKYISIRLPNIKKIGNWLDIPKTVTDLPCWFVKKYIPYITLSHHHMSSHINYKFIVNNFINYKFLVNIIHHYREHYIKLLSDVTDICVDTQIDTELHECILRYC